MKACRIRAHALNAEVLRLAFASQVRLTLAQDDKNSDDQFRAQGGECFQGRITVRPGCSWMKVSVT